MPLTAFSTSRRMELDVQQLLVQLGAETGYVMPSKITPIPESWKVHCSTDLECPSCFCTGAEVVRASKSKDDGHNVRQAYFRFPQSDSSAGHHPFCDFSGNVSAAFIPENLVQFSSAKDGVSRVVRELVCKGIQLGVFTQWDIRRMREWFFQTKLQSQFTITLDPKLPGWLDDLHRHASWPQDLDAVPIELTTEVLRIPGFNFESAATREVSLRHLAILNIIREKRLYPGAIGVRLEKLATDYHRKSVFDPTVLQDHFQLTNRLAAFMCSNYMPMRRLSKAHQSLSVLKNVKPLLAFSALLLFITHWCLDAAASRFAQIASSKLQADETLGNVMGLNPFHDYAAWSMLKSIQDLPPIQIPPMSVKEEISFKVAELKKQAGASN
ncbi:hypothetical protein NS383_01860 [Pseudomonas oryzihabitans]|nr:hypothetical protein NS383_01860 [Pseudomonas psychrotolerans]